jgi:sporulation protein YlmC with PRC-barrel domain
MAHLGTLRDYEFATEAEDIRGSKLYGRDNEKLGTIEDVIFDHPSGEIRYLVVVADGWLDNRRFLVPGNSISPSAETRDDFYAPITKDQVKRLPAYDEKNLQRDEDWGEYERKYNLVWEEDPVMRIKGTDRVLIPPHEMEESMDSGDIAAADSRDTGTAELRSPMGTPPSQAGEKTSSAIRQRWQNFEEALRNNREEILARCGVCHPKAEREREVA